MLAVWALMCLMPLMKRVCEPAVHTVPRMMSKRISLLDSEGFNKKRKGQRKIVAKKSWKNAMLKGESFCVSFLLKIVRIAKVKPAKRPQSTPLKVALLM